MARKNAMLALRRKWYARLKKEGFKDIEVLLDNGHMADTMVETFKVRANRHPYVMEEQQGFYRLASWFLHEFNFESETDKLIWEHFSNGMPMRKIGDIVGYSVRTVHIRIHKIIRGPFQDYRRMVFHDAN